MVAKDVVPVDPQLDAEFDQAFELLRSLVDLSEADALCPVRSNAVYVTSVVLWMLVYQRMHADSSLEAAVKMLIDSRPHLLPRNKRVVDETLSTSTGGYSRARSRMPLEAPRWLAEQVSQSLIRASPASFDQKRVFLIDGTTITLAPEEELRRQYPPASNQHGEGVWPVALLVVAHELASGAALIPEVGAMYGPHAVSETALVRNCLSQLPPDGVVMADAGYGIFAVAWDVQQSGRPFVLRMTRQRFTALQRQAVVVEAGSDWTTYSHRWRPSSKERRAHPELPLDAEVDVRLHAIRLSDSLTLFLATTLPHSAKSLSELYRRRNEIEIDIRNLKVVLDTEHIRARSTDMFPKELLSSLVAYNLVTQFRRQAAELIQQPPRRLSFKRTWTTFRQFLWSSMQTDAAAWRDRYRTALRYAMRDKLPNRPNRAFPREAYTKRHKSAQYKKRRPPNKPKPDS